MTDVTADEADEAMAQYGPDDLAFLADYHAKTQVAPVWRAALERALAKSGGGGKKARDHRRGRRG